MGLNDVFNARMVAERFGGGHLTDVLRFVTQGSLVTFRGSTGNVLYRGFISLPNF